MMIADGNDTDFAATSDQAQQPLGNDTTANTQAKDGDVEHMTVLSAFGDERLVPVPAAVVGEVTDHALAEKVRAELSKRFAAGTDIMGGVGTNSMDEWMLVSRGMLNEQDLMRVYMELAGLPPAADDEFSNVSAFPEASYSFLVEKGCVPIQWDLATTVIAVYHPYSLGKLAWQWHSLFPGAPRFVLGRRTMVEHALTSAYDMSDEDSRTGGADDNNEEALRDLAKEAPIVRLVNDVFSRAIDLGASDIHVEPTEDQLFIRFRVDGVLQNILTPPLSNYSAIASRLKLLANMNIAERRRPQDGRIDWGSGRLKYDVRVSTLPSVHGESIVMRLLAKDTTIFNLDNIGLSEHTLKKIYELLRRPYGIMLVVGPTGSGKTTTLYSAMKVLNAETTKIITIEDPVEYQIKGLTQIQVNTKIGLTFANGLRSIVRQDPDIILVGEIRDRETAEIAIHAALTGHLVFSTLHTNDAAGAVSRLLEMGLEGFLMASALLGILSQRLVRKYCQQCHGQGRLHGDTGDEKRCRECGGRGYSGRTGIYELLVINEDIRRAINENRTSTEITAIARRHGMTTLREDGQAKVEHNVTSLEEVERVCQLDIEE